MKDFGIGYARNRAGFFFTVNSGTSAWRRGSKLRDWRLNLGVPGFELMMRWRCFSESWECDRILGADRILCRGSNTGRTLGIIFNRQNEQFFPYKTHQKL